MDHPPRGPRCGGQARAKLAADSGHTAPGRVGCGKTYQAEGRLFEFGQRDSTDVLFAAERLAVVQLEEVRALVDFELAKVKLAVATGTMLGFGQVYWWPLTSHPPPHRTANPDHSCAKQDTHRLDAKKLTKLRHTPIGRKQGGAGRMPRMGGVGEGQLRVRKDKEAREAQFVP